MKSPFCSIGDQGNNIEENKYSCTYDLFVVFWEHEDDDQDCRRTWYRIWWKRCLRRLPMCKSYLLSSVFDKKHSSKTANNNNFVTYIIVSERIRLRDKYMFVWEWMLYFQPDSEDTNEMVFCDKCDICVHQVWICVSIKAVSLSEFLICVNFYAKQ